MSATITPLPTAATSYVTIGKQGQRWGIYLVTPLGPKRNLRTQLAIASDRDAAADYAKEVAETKKRPLRLPARKGGAECN